MRSRFLVFVFMLLTVVLAAQEPNHIHYSIDLKTIGYPEPPCDYMFPEDSFTKNHIEFLDSEQMLISFPADTTGCDKEYKAHGYFLPAKFRSIVIDFSGNALHSFDWQRGQDIQAGPNGHILFSTGREIRILDSDFSLLQSIPDPSPEHPREFAVLVVDPARRGFIVHTAYPPYYAAYFSGSPAKKILEVDNCWFISVEGGFVCWERSHPDYFSAHLGPNAPKPDMRDKSTIQHPGLEGNPDKGWLLPGWPAMLSRERRSISSSGREMYFSTGVLFPITDISGFGYFLRVIVVDTKQKRTIFRKQYDIKSEAALSPDGKWFAVREGTRLTLRGL